MIIRRNQHIVLLRAHLEVAQAGGDWIRLRCYMNGVFHYVTRVCCERSAKQEMKAGIAAKGVSGTVKAHQPRSFLYSPQHSLLLSPRQLALGPHRKDQIALIEAC